MVGGEKYKEEVNIRTERRKVSGRTTRSYRKRKRRRRTDGRSVRKRSGSRKEWEMEEKG
jgi:hypothetical protein